MSDSRGDARALAGRLFRLAAEHARRAVNVGVDAPLAVYDRTTSLGAAAEFLLKATLAGVNPVFLAGDVGVGTLARLSGARVVIDESLAATTVGAAAARTRLNQLLPEGLRIGNLTQVFPARNGAIHLGDELSATEMESARSELVRLVREVFEARRHLNLPADWDEFWSPKYAGMATAIDDQTIDDLKARFALLISEASAKYARLVADLDAERRRDIVDELSTRADTLDYLTREHLCPACGNHTLHALYELRRQVEIDDSDAPHSFAWSVHQTAELDFATCPVCDLHLDRASVAFTEIPLTLDLGESDASQEDIDAWTDGQYDQLQALAEHADTDPYDTGE